MLLITCSVLGSRVESCFPLFALGIHSETEGLIGFQNVQEDLRVV